MYCEHCGKEIADDAFMCPNCGTPVNSAPTENQPQSAEPVKAVTGTEANAMGLSVAAFMLAMIAFVTGIIFGALSFVIDGWILLFFIIGPMTIFPALTSLAIGVYVLYTTKSKQPSNAKTLSILSIVFSAFVFVFLFLACCVILDVISHV